MSIVKSAKKDPSKNPDAFIAGAPDAGKAKGVIRGKRRVITTGFNPDTIDRIDAAAAKLGIARAAWINMAVNKALAAQE